MLPGNYVVPWDLGRLDAAIAAVRCCGWIDSELCPAWSVAAELKFCAILVHCVIYLLQDCCKLNNIVDFVATLQLFDLRAKMVRIFLNKMELICYVDGATSWCLGKWKPGVVLKYIFLSSCLAKMRSSEQKICFTCMLVIVDSSILCSLCRMVHFYLKQNFRRSVLIFKTPEHLFSTGRQLWKHP